jgi:hypothetical protein
MTRAADEVRSHWIVSEDHLAEIPVSAMQRPVTFHGNYTVRDDEVHWHSRTDIKDAPVDAVPMQNVLGPAILRAGHYADMFFMLSVTPAQ